MDGTQNHCISSHYLMCMAINIGVNSRFLHFSCTTNLVKTVCQLKLVTENVLFLQDQLGRYCNENTNNQKKRSDEYIIIIALLRRIFLGVLFSTQVMHYTGI